MDAVHTLGNQKSFIWTNSTNIPALGQSHKISLIRCLLLEQAISEKIIDNFLNSPKRITKFLFFERKPFSAETMENTEGVPIGTGDANNAQVPNNGGEDITNEPLPSSALPAPIRDIRPRFIYNRAQKEKAVRLLDKGIPCRKVARMIGPHCSSGSPIKWRQQARRQAAVRQRLEEMMRGHGGSGHNS